MDQKVALVTGGTKGLGKTLTVKLAAEGWTTVSTYSSDEKAASLLRNFLAKSSTGSLVLKSDISDAKANHRLFETIDKEFGRLDALIINACSSFQLTHFVRLDWEEFQNHLNVTLKGAFHCYQHSIGIMKKNKSGKIINILSDAIQENHATGFSHYLAAKYALLGLSRSIHAELSRFGIITHNVYPGLMNTTLTQQWPEPLVQQLLKGSKSGEFTSLDSVAESVLNLIANKEVVAE